MKTKRVKILCALALALTLANTVSASDSGMAVAADALVVRPVSLAATIIGSAVFVISLPFAAASHSIDDAADALIREPYEFTFIRPLGDFDSLAY